MVTPYVKNRIIDKAILIASIFVFIIVLIGLIRWFVTGWSFANVSFIAISLLLWILVFFKKHFSLLFKLHSISLLLLTVSLVGLVEFSDFLAFSVCLVPIVLMIIFDNKKFAYLYSGIYIVAYLFIGMGYHFNWTNIKIDLSSYGQSPIEWIIPLLTIITVAIIIIASLNSFYSELVHKINEKKQEEEKLIIQSGKLEKLVKEQNHDLKEREERFRQITENIEEVFWLFDPKEEQIIYVSPAYKKIMGRSDEEIVDGYDDWINSVHPDDRNYAEQTFYAALKGEDVEPREYRTLRPDGTVRWLHDKVFPIKDTQGNIIRVTGVANDITDRKEMEIKLEQYRNNLQELLKKRTSELVESETKFRNMSDMANDMIIMMDDKENIVYWNKKAEYTLGYKKDEILGKPLHTILAIHKHQETFSQLANTGKGNTVGKTLELGAIHKDGHEIDIELSLSSIMLDTGRNVIGIIRDISERKRYELELVKAKEKAEESDRLKSAFLANMSHEIRTPMNGILGFTDLLKNHNLSGEEQKKYIDIIEKSGKRLLNTIHDIIDISKIESGQEQVLLSEINVNTKINELYEFFQLEANNKNIKLQVNTYLPDHKAIIKSDKEKLYSILSNLIKNAIKYTHEGSIQFGYVLENYENLPKLKFYVKDTGVGIPIERQQAIFNRFEQADIEDVEVYEGSGLGLAISKAYVEMLDGEIWVESEVGFGSVFYFSLPFKPMERVNVKSNENSIVTHKKLEKQLKILIVEDEEYVVDYLKIILKDYAKDFLFASKGTDAVEICKYNPDIDIVLMDIKIPELNGLEATHKIRQFNKNIFIMAQTAFAKQGDKEKCIAAGCNAFITKPISQKELFKNIYEIF